MSNTDIDAAYDRIDRHLRNTLGDVDYAEYSKALEKLYGKPAVKAPDTDALVRKLREFTYDYDLREAHCALGEAADTIERLTRERDDAVADAARYRWLREQSFPWGAATWLSLGELDAAVDNCRTTKAPT